MYKPKDYCNLYQRNAIKTNIGTTKIPVKIDIPKEIPAQNGIHTSKIVDKYLDTKQLLKTLRNSKV